MANQIFHISLGSFVEKVRDSSSNIGIMLLQVAEGDTFLDNYTTVAEILAASNTECDFTNYARKTGITGTITIDNVNKTADVDIPDQVFTSAGGATNNSVVKVISFYEQAANDSGRIPMSFHDASVTTDGTDLTLTISANGLMRATGI